MNKRPPSPHDVLSALSMVDPVAHDAVTGKIKLRGVNAYRRAGMAAARAFGWSYPKIGAAFGRDHTTVIYACNQYRKRQEARERGSEDEALIFRRLIRAANEVAQRRRSMA